MRDSSTTIFQVVQIGLSTYAILVLLMQIAPRFGFVDQPSDRKKHLGKVPLVGGIGIYFGAGLYIVDFYSRLNAPIESQTKLIVFLLFAGAFVVLGATDDRIDLSPKIKLVSQLALGAALLVTPPFSGTQINDFGIPAWLSFFVLTIYISASINAFNMLDGSDGLAGAVASTLLSILMIISLLSGAYYSFMICSVFLGAVMAFLALNAQTPWRPRAALFLGDAGSLLLGFVIVSASIDLLRSPAQWQFSHIVFFMAFPLSEMINVSFRRIAAGRHPFCADRLHMHHLLIDHGVHPSTTASIIAVANGLAAILATAQHLTGTHPATSVFVFITFLAGHAVIVHHLTDKKQLV